MVYAKTRQFLARSARLRRRAVVLDIPLLFETAGERHCDQIVCVITAPAVQRRRALARPGMSQQKLAGILAAQVDNATRHKHADALVTSGAGVGLAYRRLLIALSQKSSFKRVQAGRRHQNGLKAAWPPRGRRHGFWQRPALYSPETQSRQ